MILVTTVFVLDLVYVYSCLWIKIIANIVDKEFTYTTAPFTISSFAKYMMVMLHETSLSKVNSML